MRHIKAYLSLTVQSLLQDWEEGDGKYVAPELLDADVKPTPAADIYSLGATLYECATGKAMHLFADPSSCQARLLQSFIQHIALLP